MISASEPQRSPRFDKALELHYRRYYEQLVNQYRRGKLSPVAEDVVQEAYTRALEQWEDYDGTTSFATWFGSKILPQAGQALARAEAKHGQSDSLDDPDVEAIPDEVDYQQVAEHRLTLQQIGQLIKDQPEPKRDILRSVLVDGKPYEVVAREQSMGLSAIKLTVHRFREELNREDSSL